MRVTRFRFGGHTIEALPLTMKQEATMVTDVRVVSAPDVLVCNEVFDFCGKQGMFLEYAQQQAFQF